MNPLKTLGYRLLRQSERYLKTDMVYAAHGGFWLFVGQGMGVLVSLVFAVAFANLLTPEQYGNYKYVLSLAAVIGAFSLTGFTTALMRASARGHDGTLSHTARVSFVSSIVMVVLAAIGGTYYMLQGNEFLGISLFIIGATSPFIASASLYRPFLMGRQEFKKTSLYGALQSAIPMLSVLIALLLKAPLIVLVALYFTINALILTILYRHTKRLVKNDIVDPGANRIGAHLSVMGIISTIAGKLDSILIFQLMGGAELALFSLAITLPDTIRGSLKNITALAIPKFAKKTKEEMKRAVWSKTLLIFFLSLALTGAYVIAAPLLFDLLFPQYRAAIPYTQVYAFTILTSLVLASAYFDSQAAIKERYILNVVNSTTTIVATVVGIVWFGLWGAIAARIIARIINIALSSFLITRH